jgi:hypothetical protein
MPVEKAGDGAGGSASVAEAETGATGATVSKKQSTTPIRAKDRPSFGIQER